MKDRLVIINHNARLYQKSNKKVKTQILNELTRILHMNRQYLAWLLRNCGKLFYRKQNIVFISTAQRKELSKRGRKKIYNDQVQSWFDKPKIPQYVQIILFIIQEPRAIKQDFKA